MNTPAGGYRAGWVAEFEDEESLMTAVNAVLAAGWQKWDVFAPCPCEPVRLAAMRRGAGKARFLSLMGTCGGVLGLCAVWGWLYATQDVLSHSLVNQGRLQGLEWWFGYIPVLFVGTLLGAGLMLAAGFLYASGLPRWFDWVSACPMLADRATSDGFFIVVDVSCGSEAERLLKELAPVRMEWVEELEIEREDDR